MALDLIAPGQVATIVTYLDMRERPDSKPLPVSPLELAHWPRPELDGYRELFRRVGTPWLWFSRLLLDDAALAKIVWDPEVSVHAVEGASGAGIGMLELDFRKPGECEIAYFGLVPEFAGQGYGGWLMARALALAWRLGVGRVHVHTCTLDHPGALGFYRRSGFTPRGIAVEIFADPRLTGALPRASAPHVPIIAP